MKLQVDGVEGDYFTQEELEAAKLAAIKEKEEDFSKREAELSELENPNIKILREKAKNWEKFEKTGKNIDEKGQIVDQTPRPISQEDVARMTRQEILDARKQEYLDSFEKDKRDVVSHYFDKLTAGEEVNASNMRDFVSKAAKLAEVEEPDASFGKFSSGRGGAPEVNLNNKKEDFADTDAGKSAAESMGLRI